MQVVFHGTQLEQTELLAALTRNCLCLVDPETGGTTSRCPGHTALVSSQSFVDHLEFARWLRVQLNVEEFLEESP